MDERISFVVAQDTPYLNIINDEQVILQNLLELIKIKHYFRIKKLHQVGLIDKWLKDYLPQKDRCWKNRHIIEVNNHTVNMDDMQGSFFVLFFGKILDTFQNLF